MKRAIIPALLITLTILASLVIAIGPDKILTSFSHVSFKNTVTYYYSAGTLYADVKVVVEPHGVIKINSIDTKVTPYAGYGRTINKIYDKYIVHLTVPMLTSHVARIIVYTNLGTYIDTIYLNCTTTP